MNETTLRSLPREALEAEILRLQSALEDADIAARSHRSEADGAAAALDVSRNRVSDLEADRTALARSEARQRAVFESAIDFAMIVLDPEGVVTDWNPGAERVMGWRAEEMVGSRAERIFTPEDRASGRVGYEMQRALTHGRASDERWHLREDGARFWASGEMMPLYGEHADHLGFVKILRDRTSEHLAGVALHDAEERYRLATRATNDAIWDWDLTSNQVRWNEALEEAYGHDPEAIEQTGDWWIAHIHAEDRARIEASIHAVIDGEATAWSDDYRFRRADGSDAQVLDRGQVIRDSSGRAVRMIGAMLDLTRIQKAEVALRTHEERFKTILDTVDVAFAIVEVKFDADDRPVDYRFLEANPAFERQAGVNLRGKWVTEFAPDLERFWFETYGRVASTGESANFESYAEAFQRWFDVRAVRVGDPAARQIAILFSDVTARHTAEERLRASEAVARESGERVQLALAAGAIIGTWHWNIPDDRFTIDEAFARAFGLDASLGREGIPLAQIVATVHPEDQAGLAEAIDEAIRRGGAYAHQYRTRRADGRYHWLEANGRVDHGPDGRPTNFPGVLIDVGERRELVEQRDRALTDLRELNDTLEQRIVERTTALMRTEEQLRQSQKMEAVGQLTGGLAHDFNNLLAGISGSLELIGRRIEQGRLTDLEKYLAAAQGASRRASALTHRLLAFSRQQTLAPRATDVDRLVAGMLDLVQRTVGPSVDVRQVPSVGLWPALVDPSQLENALLNLCINARDAMPGGGRVVIETANVTLDESDARRDGMDAGDYLSLSVTDTGTGMTDDVIDKAFDPFFTTKPIGQGTGLGLSMIYGFARQSGGQVRIRSTVGEGTTVCIDLPRHRGEAEAEETVPSTGLQASADTGQTVLIVDDEPTLRMLLTDVLSDGGYTTLETGDGAGGLRVLRSDTRIDLLVTDVGLPGGMNGRQMADLARVTRPDLKVLFVTGFAETALLHHGQLETGMAVLTKPFAVDAFLSRVRELIAS